MGGMEKALLTDLLKSVSRSFYLTLRVLPGSIRPQIGLAYLLARTSDTIADTQLVPQEKRLEALQALRQRILGSDGPRLEFKELADKQGASAERTLLERCESSLELLGRHTDSDLALIRQVLDTIISGQELDVQRFGNASVSEIRALVSAEELEDYTYRVAGCVGEFWTKLCRQHVFPTAELNDELLLKQSVRFGKGLQLVNILRDLSRDLRIGRCYLPASEMSKLGLAANDLLKPNNESRLRPLYDRYLSEAEEHLQEGWVYTNALPRGSMRVRLACAWPVLIGLRTVKLLQIGNVLEPKLQLKVSRREVRTIMYHSVLFYPWPSKWRQLASQGP